MSRTLAYQFTLLCLRGRADATYIESAAQLAARPDFDWDAFLRFAFEERLPPLLYHTLHGRNLLPPAVEKRLRRSYDFMARRNLFLLHELSVVLDHLSALDVETVILKGAALAELVYPNIALRPMGDLDLLIRPGQVGTAVEILSKLGYIPDSRFNMARSLEFDCEAPFSKPGIEEVALDLHWSLLGWTFYLQSLQMDWFWGTTRSVKVDRSPTLILGPEAQLLYLCGHAAKHGIDERGLLWLYDIVQLLRLYQPELDWDLLLVQAQASSLVLSIQRVLPRVVEEFDAPVPSDVLVRCQQLPVSSAEARAMAGRDAKDKSVAQRAWIDLVSLPDNSSRLRYLINFALKRLFAPPAYMMNRYRIRYRPLLPFYYFYRLFEITGNIFKLILKR